MTYKASNALLFALSIILAGCATPARDPTYQALIGEWKSSVSILGQHSEEELTLNSDGTFTKSNGYSADAVKFSVATTQHGTWSVSNGVLEIRTVKYPSNPDSDAPSQQSTITVDRRDIVSLTDKELVTADQKFGIELRRQRVKKTYIEQLRDPCDEIRREPDKAKNTICSH